MLLISTLGRNNAWELAEATFMAFFRQSGHFRDVEEIPMLSTGDSAAKSGLRLTSQLPGGVEACRRSGALSRQRMFRIGLIILSWFSESSFAETPIPSHKNDE
jgi:hypothetical protein